MNRRESLLYLVLVMSAIPATALSVQEPVEIVLRVEGMI